MVFSQEQEVCPTTTLRSQPTEEWMLICQQSVDLQPNMDTQQDIDWTLAAQSYSKAPSFISHQRQAATQHLFTTTGDPHNLQGEQLQVYTIVQQHHLAISPPPLRMIVSGTAGTGKSYLIHCLRLLMKRQLVVTAPTGVAAFNIESRICSSFAHFKERHYKLTHRLIHQGFWYSGLCKAFRNFARNHADIFNKINANVLFINTSVKGYVCQPLTVSQHVQGHCHSAWSHNL